MPDIAMCKGTGCPQRDTCYRYTATPSRRQAWMLFDHQLAQDGSCRYYWQNDDAEVRRMEGEG